MPYDACMPKRRNGIMTIRIPMDEKDLLQTIADQHDITLSDVVVRAVRDFIASQPGSSKKTGAKTKARPVGI
jgi:predicted transcriptional regulator